MHNKKVLVKPKTSKSMGLKYKYIAELELTFIDTTSSFEYMSEKIIILYPTTNTNMYLLMLHHHLHYVDMTLTCSLMLMCLNKKY